MRIISCCQPFFPARPDAVYEHEIQVARSLGMETALIDFEALVDNSDIKAALARIRPSESPEFAVYRGWMLTPRQYVQLYDGLGNLGLRLVNTPEQYKHCHYLPESYSVIEAVTPRSVFLPLREPLDFDEVMRILIPFGDRPLILKDYVKSRKHEWAEACYIPVASDRPAVEAVVRRFVELQGDQLNEGLVFREYVEFQHLTRHSKSGSPLSVEFRLFFLDGKLVLTSQYWEEGKYGEVVPPAELFRDIALAVRSRFFTMDVALLATGQWLIVELGDAQVAALPERADVADFYRQLKRAGGEGRK
jgi:ATP-grasp domain-containing protein